MSILINLTERSLRFINTLVCAFTLGLLSKKHGWLWFDASPQPPQSSALIYSRVSLITCHLYQDYWGICRLSSAVCFSRLNQSSAEGQTPTAHQVRLKETLRLAGADNGQCMDCTVCPLIPLSPPRQPSSQASPPIFSIDCIDEVMCTLKLPQTAMNSPQRALIFPLADLSVRLLTSGHCSQALDWFRLDR